MDTQNETLAQPTAPRPWAGRVSGSANAVPFQVVAWSAPCTMALQNMVFTHESEGMPEAVIPVGLACDQTEPSKRKVSPWPSSARQSVVEGQSTAPNEEPRTTAIGDDQPVGAVVVVVECPVVAGVEDDVVRGPAADVQAAVRRATTAIGVRIRSSALGGR